MINSKNLRKPILRRTHYPIAMNQHRLPITFAVGKPHTLEVMEAVLAIARRGGCQLASLVLRDGEHANHVALELLAPEPELLDLFVTRLNNLFDIAKIEVSSTVPVAKCAMFKLRQS